MAAHHPLVIDNGKSLNLFEFTKSREYDYVTLRVLGIIVELDGVRHFHNH